MSALVFPNSEGTDDVTTSYPPYPPQSDLGGAEPGAAPLPFAVPDGHGPVFETPTRRHRASFPIDGEGPATSHPPLRERARVGVSVVIPAKNEGKNLPYVLERVPDCVDEIIVVDSSSDVTPIIVRSSCREDVQIIPSPMIGKGNALRMGFEAAKGEIIVAMDADGSMAPEEIPQFVYFLEHGYDFVKGSRFIGGGGSLDITPIRRAGNKALLAIANFLYDTNLTDLCYGYFAFRRCFLDHLELQAAGFEIEAEVTVRAVLAGLRVCEVPSLEMPRRRGHSNLHAVADGQRVLLTLLHERTEARRAALARTQGARPVGRR